jgi:hypothetical protein
MNRRLTLKTERLAELATSELRSVVGAQALTNNQGICYSLMATTCRTGIIMTIDTPCD